jgi:hypothetical protein
VEPESYPGISRDASESAEHVLENTKPGSIVLLHVMPTGRSESREALVLSSEAFGCGEPISDIYTIPQLEVAAVNR